MADVASEKVYRISIDGNASAEGKAIARSSVTAAQAIADFDAQAKSLSASLRRLRGNSVETKTAKAALTKSITKAKDESAKLTQQLLKEGVGFAAASKAAKKHADILAASKKRGTEKRDKQKQSGGLGGSFLKIKDAGKRFGELRAATGSTGGALKALAAEARLGTGALNMLGAGASMAASAAVVGVLAFGALVVGLAAFAIHASDAAAHANRLREALWGNATDAKNLGSQIQELAGKVPQGVEELNALALSLSKTKLSGKATVNTLNAVAQAAGAVDSSAGDKIKEIITRNQHMGRMQLGRRELQGTGLDFTDVAAAYAKVSKKSVKQAQFDLLSGRATMEKGAEAFRAATEKKFGKLNKTSAFSITNAPKKFFDQLSHLASGVDLSGLSAPLEDLSNQLKPGSPLGAGIKTLMETLGKGFVEVAKVGIPMVVDGLTWLVVGALKVTNAFLEIKIAAKKAFNADGWTGMGEAIVQGIVKGIKSGLKWLNDASNDMAYALKTAFTNAMKIKSPSRVFAGYGKFLPQGTAQGVREDTPKAVKAVEQMGESVEAAAIGSKVGGKRGDAPAPTPAGRAAAPPAASAGIGELHLHFENMKHEEAAAIVADTSLLGSLTKIVGDALKVSGRGGPAFA